MLSPAEGGQTSAQQQIGSGQQQNFQAGGDQIRVEGEQSQGGSAEPTKPRGYASVTAVVAFVLVAALIILGIAGSIAWAVVVPLCAAVAAVAGLVIKRA